ncbi:BlaI/MecI/CopY family transcriptional regulator [Streptomyces cavernae]|uniref:BlaI/MecI/CopY family transcriptional regulator n=1 Tax=Streptomyces cavernae TaxID=2259034 RepID=UPI000FEBA829|nr:BlaI/MecI/CopY family transcriptional regulator [Streptomyces cavernae]
MVGRDPHGRAERRAAGELESEVLSALWATDRPLTPAEIQSGLGGGLAYNTVHTILKRLHDKGLVLRDAGGRRGAYRPAKNAAELAAEAMREALDRAPDPIAALRQFVMGLNPEEETALRELLGGDEPRRNPEGPRPGGAAHHHGRGGTWIAPSRRGWGTRRQYTGRRTAAG